jgi:hypothetical protein
MDFVYVGKPVLIKADKHVLLIQNQVYDKQQQKENVVFDKRVF